MTSRIQHRRSLTAGAALPGLPMLPGELGVNLPDLALFTTATGTPVPLLGVRAFAATAKYALSDIVAYAGGLYGAKAAVGPKAFDPADWTLLTSSGGVMTSIVQLLDGAANAPSLAFASEPTLGLYRAGAGKLGVAGDLALADNRQVAWGDGSSYIQGNGATDVLTLGGVQVNTPAILRVGGAAYGTLGIREGGAYGGAGPSASIDGIVVESSGNTGLSILTPNANNGVIAFGDSDLATVGQIQYAHATDAMALITASAARLTLTAAASTFTVPIIAPLGTLAAPSYSFASRLDTGLWSPGSNQVGLAITNEDLMRWQLVTGEARILVNDATSHWGGTGRSVVEVNGTSGSGFGLNIAGVAAGAMIVSANSLEFNTPSATPVPITFKPGGNERGRFNVATQAEFLVGTATPAFSFANRGIVEINGTSSSLLGLSIAGTAQGYVVATGSTVQLQHASGTVSLGIAGAQKLNVTSTTLFDVINNQELGWRDMPQTVKVASYVLTTGDRGAMVTMNTAGSITINQNILQGGQIVTVYNNSGGNITVVAGAGVTMRWNTGASQVTTTPRTLGANALVNIVAVTGSIVALKGDGIS